MSRTPDLWFGTDISNNRSEQTRPACLADFGIHRWTNSTSRVAIHGSWDPAAEFSVRPLKFPFFNRLGAMSETRGNTSNLHEPAHILYK
jgi:hypothetical protein